MITRQHHFASLVAIAFLVAAFLCGTAPKASAIILYRSGDPTANTTAPTGTLANSGWQWEGIFGDYLGTAIAPHYFITAQHIGFADGKFTYRGVTYNTLAHFDDPDSDLRIFQIDGTLPDYAPLFAGKSEVGEHCVAIGRGKQRGGQLNVNGAFRGWNWGATDTVQRWGENTVAAIKPLPPGGDMVYATFDKNGLPNECHLANGDSGGALFVDDGGVWKLAGIHYDVDSVYTSPQRQGILFAAIFDERGLYDENSNLITGDAPVPSGFYSTRIASHIAWVDSILEPRLANIAARATVGGGDQVAIAGFIINGTAGQKERVIIRGLGPSLQANGVPLSSNLLNPVLELRNSEGTLIAGNDNWRNSSQAAAIEATGLAPSDDSEAAILANLPVGAYTAILRGAGAAGGIGLIEVYDADVIGHARLLNLSARANVGTGDNVLIGGLIVHSSQQLLIRAIGPDLANQGVPAYLANPKIELYDANGALTSANDNWHDAANATAISATNLAPGNPLDAAILFSPKPGNYTVIVRGASSSQTGVALLESYLLQ